MIYKKEGKYVLPNLYLGKKYCQIAANYLTFAFFVFTGKQTLSISDLPLHISKSRLTFSQNMDEITFYRKH